ncbi:MAG: right-handed parallel beta-helix repeat-containing protein [Thermoproteota archaeon]
MAKGIEIKVGLRDADIIGSDNRVLQAAVDYVSGLGGGTIEIGSGTYLMQDSLHLRSNLVIKGCGTVVLQKCDGFSSKLVEDGDYGEEQVKVEDPSGFKAGMGVAITDSKSGGFHVTVRTIIGIDDRSLILNGPLLNDYMVDNDAVAKNAFPIISGYYIEDVKLENLRIEGNRERNGNLNGCRGGGIFLYRANRVNISKVEACNYNGDGISFQQSNDILIEGCVCKGNANLGLHPGSGSQRPIIRKNDLRENAEVGLYLCWRVKKGLFEYNNIVRNGETGISIGHKDTDNIFRNNVVMENGVYGILFREEKEPMGGHRNIIQNNVIKNNGSGKRGFGIFVGGETCDISIVDNVITDTRKNGEKKQRIGIYIGKKAKRIMLSNNTMDGNAEKAVQDDSAL